MGYLSNVAIVFSKEGYNTFTKVLRKEYRNDIVHKVEDFMDNCTIKKCDILSSAKAFYWRFVKWERFESIFDENAALSSSDSILSSNVINNVLKKLHEDQFHFVDIGELDDDNYTVGYYTDNPFGIGIRRTIVGIEEGEELHYLLMTKHLNYRSIKAICNFTASNISSSSIIHKFRAGKDIKQSLAELVFKFIFLTNNDSSISDKDQENLIDFCIELMNDTRKYSFAEKEKYSISSLVYPVYCNGVTGLVKDKGCKNDFHIATVIYGIVNALIFGSSDDSHKNDYNATQSYLRRLEIV